MYTLGDPSIAFDTKKNKTLLDKLFHNKTSTAQ